MNHFEASPAVHAAANEPAGVAGRWAGDTGELSIDARRALLRLIQGPYLSASRAPAPWSALLADEHAVRTRLHDLFLDLVIDRDNGFAFVRNAQTGDVDVPVAVRSEKLTFLDSAMLLVLRQILLAGEHEGRVIIGEEDVFEQLSPFRTSDRDQTDFTKRLNASWRKMKNTLRVVHTTSDDRVEISPVLRMLVDADQVKSLTEIYRSIAAAGNDNDDDDVEITIPGLAVRADHQGDDSD